MQPSTIKRPEDLEAIRDGLNPASPTCPTVFLLFESGLHPTPDWLARDPERVELSLDHLRIDGVSRFQLYRLKLDGPEAKV